MQRSSLFALVLAVLTLATPRAGAEARQPLRRPLAAEWHMVAPPSNGNLLRTPAQAQAALTPTLGQPICATIPQVFPITGTPNASLPAGTTLATNEPASGVPFVSLNNANGVPLVIPASGTLTLSAGGSVANGVQILPSPFVKPNAPDAFVTLNVPGQPPSIVSCPVTAAPTLTKNLFVANPPFGQDQIDCSNQIFGSYCANFCSPNATLCANNCQQQSFPCATIQYAISRARDGDAITVQSTPLPYIIQQTIEVPILVTIKTDGNKVVLQSGSGAPIFHVTATGSPQNHVTIGGTGNGFILGGATSTTQPGAIQLDGDSYTTVQGNIVGQEDLPNGIGVLLHNSDHPTIDGNVIHGSSIFTTAPALQVGAVQTGFGIVTAECLGAPEPSDSVTITNNLLAFNSNAGVWLCSDQGGGHAVNSNTLRYNGRGIVLFDVVDSTLNANVIVDNQGDGIQVVGESANDLLSANVIESQTGTDSAGVRLWGNGGIVFPLSTQLTQNFLRRNTVDVVIAGARATTLTNNTIEAGDYRTGVLLLVGSTLAGGKTAQPTDTVFNGNTLLYDGFCTATVGCAIRLAPGVVVDVAAQTNNFGFPSTSLNEIRGVIWDREQDPGLGRVLLTTAPPAPAGATALPPGLLVTPSPIVVPSSPGPGTPRSSISIPASTPAPTSTSTIVPGSSGGAQPTALCSDGTFSFTAPAAGPCTGHGGVRMLIGAQQLPMPSP